MGWALFYVTDMSRLKQLLSIMFGQGGAPLTDVTLSIVISNNIFWLGAVLLFCMPVTQWVKRRAQAIGQRGQVVVQGCTAAMNLVILFLCTAMLVGQSYNPFLYFRF